MELSFLAPLPHVITISHIPNLNDIRSTWRQGMK